MTPKKKYRKKEKLKLNTPEAPEFVELYVELVETNEGLEIEFAIIPKRLTRFYDAVHIFGSVSFEKDSGTQFKADANNPNAEFVWTFNGTIAFGVSQEPIRRPIEFLTSSRHVIAKVDAKCNHIASGKAQIFSMSSPQVVTFAAP